MILGKCVMILWFCTTSSTTDLKAFVIFISFELRCISFTIFRHLN
jgi:hypothetical protein